jgi:hypothetical protein
MGVKMAEFDGDFIFLEVVQNGFCILAIQSFSAFNFRGTFSAKGGLFSNNFPKLKNSSFANIYQSPFAEAVKAGFIMSCLLYYCE